MQYLFNYILHLADNALILGHRMSEWTGVGPVIEQDIAITNCSLDHIGQARSLYQYAAELFNSLSVEEQLSVFKSPLITQKINDKQVITEDDLAYLRDSWDFKNFLLVEQPNGDWAQTIARSFLYDQYSYLMYQSLSKCSNPQLSAIAVKSLKEVTYHKRWSSEWLIRLGDGTDISKQKMQLAIDELWPYSGEMFHSSEIEKTLINSGIIEGGECFLNEWKDNVTHIMSLATLEIPENVYMHQGGKNGVHSEYLGYVLAEMQFMQRAYPNMEW